MRRLVLMALMVIATMGQQRGTLAYLTGAGAGASNTFTAGKVVLGQTPAVSGLMSFASKFPGSKEYGEVTVANDGTVSFRYALKSEYVASGGNPSSALTTALQLTVKTNGDATGTCSAAGFSSYTTILYQGSLVPTDNKIVGDITTGSQTGDRTLPPTGSNSEKLCFEIYLPESASDSLQNTTAAVTFTFVAEQLSGT